MLALQVQVLCALVSADSSKQRWLQTAGIIPLLQRLTLQRSLDVDQVLALAKWENNISTVLEPAANLHLYH